MTAKPLPPIDLIRRLYSYDPETGRFTFIERDRGMFSSENRMNDYNRRRLGKYGDTYLNNGYRRLFIATKKHRSEIFSAHRIAFLLCHGFCPEIIDHINGDRTDNRIENLRPSSVSENSKNRRMNKNNRYGHTGIRRTRNGKRWVVQLNIAKKQTHLGTFDTLEDAIKCYESAKANDGYDSSHGHGVI
jgi:hypothetical protein